METDEGDSSDIALSGPGCEPHGCLLLSRGMSGSAVACASWHCLSRSARPDWVAAVVTVAHAFAHCARSPFADSRAIGVPPRASWFASFSAGAVGRFRFASRPASGSGTLMPMFSGSRGVAMSGFRVALSVGSCAARLAGGLAASRLTLRSTGRPTSGAASHRPPRAGACYLRLLVHAKCSRHAGHFEYTNSPLKLDERLFRLADD